MELVLGSIGNSIYVISFILPAIILLVLYSKARNLLSSITIEEGRFFSNYIIIFYVAIAIAIYIVLIFLRKYILY